MLTRLKDWYQTKYKLKSGPSKVSTNGKFNTVIEPYVKMTRLGLSEKTVDNEVELRLWEDDGG